MYKYIGLLENKHKKNRVKGNEVVLIAERIKPRIAKIAYALKRKNFRVILCLEKRNKKEIENVNKSFFSNIYFFTGKEDLYKRCLSFSPVAYHLFTEATVAEWAEYIISKKTVLGKIIYDQYDIYRGFLTEDLDDNAKREKYCLEHADGICCRMFETQYLKQVYQYHFAGKRLLFLDYCWNNMSIAPKKKVGRRLRMVYGGRLIPRPNDNVERYKIELNGFNFIAETLHNSGNYFVIIPSTLCEGEKYSAYRNLKRKYSHFILKEPMDFDKLIQYESYMDYGIDCVELEEDIASYCGQEKKFNVRAKNQYYATNKYFDYLDAGVMPIYGRKNELFGWYLERFGGAVKCSLEEMPDKINILKKNRVTNNKNALQAREIFSIEKQIGRLINFYKKV